MKPQERVALLSALVDAANAELKQAKAEALAVATEHDIKAFSTAYGPLNVTRAEPKPYIQDEAAFLAWVKVTHPSELEVVVRPAFRAVIMSRLTVVKGIVLDTETGEAPEWAALSDWGDPAISWPATTQQKAVKQEARAWFGSRAEALLGGLAAIEAEAS